MTRVLLVEDERTLLRALAMNLTARDYRVSEATTGTQALSLAAEVEHDIIVLDLGLPDITGFDVIRAVRRYASTPIIVLSARTGSSDKVTALDLGADDYVTKPFNIDELLARLRAAARRASSTDPVHPSASGRPTSTWPQNRPPVPTAVPCSSPPPNGNCSTSSPGSRASSSPAVSCSPGCAAAPITPTPATCASMWHSCGTSSKPNRADRATCSPNPAWAIAFAPDLRSSLIVFTRF